MVVFLPIKYFFLYFNTGCMLSYPCLPSCMCDQANSTLSIWTVHSEQAVESGWFYCKPNQQINNRITNDLGVPWTILVALKNPTFVVSVQHTHLPLSRLPSWIPSCLLPLAAWSSGEGPSLQWPWFPPALAIPKEKSVVTVLASCFRFLTDIKMPTPWDVLLTSCNPIVTEQTHSACPNWCLN